MTLARETHSGLQICANFNNLCECSKNQKIGKNLAFTQAMRKSLIGLF